MQNVRRSVTVTCVGALVALALAGAGGAGSFHSRTQTATIDLTGVWRANDGGTYWIRQVPLSPTLSRIWWVGLSGTPNTSTMGLSFSNVFYGKLVGTSISGIWADVPRGATKGSGTLALVLKGSTALFRTSVSGGFGASIWRRTSG